MCTRYPYFSSARAKHRKSRTIPNERLKKDSARSSTAHMSKRQIRTGVYRYLATLDDLVAERVVDGNDGPDGVAQPTFVVVGHPEGVHIRGTRRRRPYAARRCCMVRGKSTILKLSFSSALRILYLWLFLARRRCHGEQERDSLLFRFCTFPSNP